MALIFSKNSGVNDDLWKDIDRALISIMKDTDTEKNKDDELVDSLFSVKKSNKFGEKTTGLTEFANFEIVGEGENAPLDDIQEGYPKLITHKQFLKKFICTAEMAEDGSIDEMKLAAANFVRSYKRSRADFASKALVTEGATFTYGSTAGLDKATGDGQGLFATTHPGKKSGVGTQSNVFTNAFGSDSAMLNRLANIGRNFKNDSGETMGYTFDTIVIPGNVPALEDLIKRIIRSDLIVGSSNNDVNTQKGLWKLVVNHKWQVTSGAPYIIMSSEANKELMGSVFYDRLGLKMLDKVDIDNHNLVWTGRTRFSAGFNNWRHVILGGATSGTTLS